MSGYTFTFSGIRMEAMPSGALWLPDIRLLCVSDLHLGKSDRVARRLGLMLPPYETAATLDGLTEDVATRNPATVVCLGDSFDDIAAADSLTETERLQIATLQAGREWIWIAGNHDAGPVAMGGSYRETMQIGPLSMRHIAQPGETAEISGHYHPKLSLPGSIGASPCFLVDTRRIILPAYGAYTGGMRATDPVLRNLMAPQAVAILTGRRCLPIPLPAAR